MKVLLTAFGPFDDRLVNASSLALEALKVRHPEWRTRVFPVDSVVAPSRLKRAIRELRPEVLLMLGEAAGSREIRLERTGWNLLDFGIPDLAGRQPRGVKMIQGGPERLSSTLPFEAMEKRLLAAGYPVRISDDPGRYLCNQVLYVALNALQRSGLRCRAGFVHLPLAADYPTEEAAKAIELLLESEA